MSPSDKDRQHQRARLDEPPVLDVLTPNIPVPHDPRPRGPADTHGSAAPTSAILAADPGNRQPTVAGTRASDAEREQAVARLYHALGEGRLDLEETEERVSAAYAARHRCGLSALLADLPDSPGTPAAPRASAAPEWTAIWASAVWRARTALWPEALPTGPPSRARCRLAAAVTLLAAIWTIASAVLGAALVAL
jgi:Domain of unknown function (DUF1707)